MDDAPSPYPDAATHLRDELRRVWLRVEYQIRVGWEQGLLVRSQNEEGGEAVWTPENLGSMFRSAADEYSGAVSQRPDAGAQQVLDVWLKHSARVDGRIRATVAANRRLPLIELGRVFRLTPRQWATLMYALMPEVDPNLVNAYRYLARDASCRGLDGRLLALVVYDTPESRSLLARDLAPSSPLVYYRLLEQQTGAQHESLLFRRLRPASRLVQMLDGRPLDLDPELLDIAELRGGEVNGMFPAELVKQATAALKGDDVILVLQGQRGIGKRLLVQLAASYWQKQMLLIDGRKLTAISPQMQQPMLRAMLREARLLDAVPVVSEIDDVINQQQEKDELPPFVVSMMAEHRGPIAITLNRERMPRIYQRPIVFLTLEVPPLGVRTALWQRTVPSLSEEDAASLSGRFAVPGGVIVASAQAAIAARMAEEGPPDLPTLDRAVANQLHERIQRLGRKLPTPHELNDLVVDDDIKDTLRGVIGAVRERRRVRETLGLRGAAGISVLFSGHPGVGKTMAGTVMANSLGLDIYEVDLSQVVSKWLGETEKNLADVFDAAEPGHVVLLFNEADSLFGKRTADVKSSNDRYANMETNYLLQRLERFGGLAILTTNLTGAIDPAFKRRFTYDVFFNFPSPEMRAELWRRTVPKKAQLGEIDFDQLADRFELSGGFIKVACERAAYASAAGNRVIDTALLRDTVEKMYRERGKLSAVGPLD